MSFNEPDIKRLLKAFKREIPDRVPNFEFIIDQRNVEAILGRKITGVMTPEDRLEIAQKIGMDAVGFGIVWGFGRVEATASDGSRHYLTGNVKDWADLKGYKPQNIDRSIEYLERCIRATRNTDIGVWIYIHSVFDSALLAMGYQDFMLKLHDDLKFVEKLMDMALEFYQMVVERVIKYDISFLHVADDIGQKTGLMIQPESFRELWVGRTKKLIKPIREKRIPLSFHSDGGYEEIIPDLIDLGFCALNPIEPLAMDIYKLKEKYGNRLCLVGNIDIAGPLAFGTPEEVQSEVKEHITRLAPGGGYVCSSSHSIVDAIPPENFRAMVDAIHTYGRYNTVPGR